MKSILTAVALSALGLAAISGCTIESGGDDKRLARVRLDYFGAGGDAEHHRSDSTAMHSLREATSRSRARSRAT